MSILLYLPLSTVMRITCGSPQQVFASLFCICMTCQCILQFNQLQQTYAAKNLNKFDRIQHLNFSTCVSSATKTHILTVSWEFNQADFRRVNPKYHQQQKWSTTATQNTRGHTALCCAHTTPLCYCCLTQASTPQWSLISSRPALRSAFSQILFGHPPTRTPGSILMTRSARACARTTAMHDITFTVTKNLLIDSTSAKLFVQMEKVCSEQLSGVFYRQSYQKCSQLKAR